MKADKWIDMPFEMFLNFLKPYPIFGEMDITVEKSVDTYKIKITDVERFDFTEEDINETIKTTLLTFGTNLDGIIEHIEHGYNVITSDNLDLVSHTLKFIGVQITDLKDYV